MSQKTANQTLTNWGILPASLEMQWDYRKHKKQDGFAYPIPERNGDGQIVQGTIARRWKNCEANAQLKNLWLPDKPAECLSIYFPPNLLTSVSLKNGSLFIVEGEKDVLSMMTAGIRNVLTWLDGAVNIPENIGELLQEFGVSEVVHLPDLDKAGRDSAAKLARMLAPYKIEYKALELPDFLGEKGDVNDLWKYCDFNPDFFADFLDNLPLMDIPSAAEERLWSVPARPSTKIGSDSEHRELPPLFISAIEQALGVQRYKRGGWSKLIPCPFHDDQTPSANWHRDNHILKCFVCAPPMRENYLAMQVAEKLNIHLRDYIEPLESMVVNGGSNSNGSVPTYQEAGTGNIQESKAETKTRKPTDDEIGDSLLASWDGNWAFMQGQWYRYSAGVWKSVNEIDKAIWAAMQQFKYLGVSPSGNRKGSIKDYLKAQCLIQPESIDVGQNYCNLLNGIFNLQTMELEPHRRDLYFTSQLNYAYDAEATCARWEAFLNDIFQVDKELIKLVQEAFGYSLTADTKYEAMLWLSGEAATGKTTLLHVLEALLGDAATGLDFNSLSRNPYQLAKLAGKRVAICSEIAVNLILSDSLVKQLVSGETMVVREIYRESIVMTPYVKLWLAMNILPQNLDRSNGVYRRTLIIPLNNPVPEEKRDKNLFNALKQELAGIFNWAMQGLKRLNEQEGFTRVELVEKAVAAYQEMNDNELSFINDNEWVALASEAKTKAHDLYLAYKLWAERFGYTPKSAKQVSLDWKRLGFERIRNSNGFCYIGMGLSHNAQDMVNQVRMKSGESLRSA